MVEGDIPEKQRSASFLIPIQLINMYYKLGGKQRYLIPGAIRGTIFVMSVGVRHVSV